MKRNRIILLILWILSLVGISFYGGPVSYGFFAMLTILPFASLVYLLFVMFFFRIYQELDSKNLVANHVVPFYFTLMNEYFFGFASIRVRFYTSFSTISGLDDEKEYELLPKTGIKKQTGLMCKYRGEYEVGVKRVEMQDYLRLFRLSYHNREALRVVVRPDLVMLEELRDFDDMDVTARDTAQRQTEPDVVVRKFEQGDDIRQIHWKSSARAGELLTRRYVGEEREGVAVLMGSFRCSEDPKVYLPVENKMLEATLALVLFFAKKKIPVTAYHLTGEGLKRSTVSGLEQFDGYYQLLSGMEFHEDYTEERFMEMLSAQRDVFSVRTVFLVLRDWSDAAAGMAALLAENQVGVAVYVVRDEPMEGEAQGALSRAHLVQLGTDADLREVM